MICYWSRFIDSCGCLFSGVLASSMSTTCSATSWSRPHRPISSWQWISKSWQLIGTKLAKNLRHGMRRSKRTLLTSTLGWWTCGSHSMDSGGSLMRWSHRHKGVFSKYFLSSSCLTCSFFFIFFFVPATAFPFFSPPNFPFPHLSCSFPYLHFSNRWFLRCLSPLFQSESKREAFHMEISFIHM